MTIFNNLAEKLDFLKRYKLISKTKTELPTFYYYAPGTDIPVICEIIGYDETYDNWAVIVIKTNDRTVNIHSSYLLEMKDRGTAYYKNKSSNEIAEPSDQKDSYIVFDIETTGFSYSTNKIIEIAAVKYTSGVVSEFHEYVKIDSIIPINITLLTGINNETIETADYIDVVMPKFLDFIGNSMLVGHNIKSFDIPFINKVCVDLGLPTVKNELTDTLYLAKEKLPELESHKLHDLCDFYKIDTLNAHHALFDCYMCDNLYRLLTSDDVEITSAANPFQKKLLSILDKIIIEKELPDKGLRLRENKNKNADSYSVLISEPPYPLGSERLGGEQSTMKIILKPDSYDIDILLSVYNDIPCPSNTICKKPNKSNNSPQHIIVSFPIDSPNLYSYIESIILYRLAHYRTAESTFSCCSKFNQCSDAKRCLHENKLYSTACTYRKNLESGRIFYGKNRNID